MHHLARILLVLERGHQLVHVDHLRHGRVAHLALRKLQLVRVHLELLLPIHAVRVVHVSMMGLMLTSVVLVLVNFLVVVVARLVLLLVLQRM